MKVLVCCERSQIVMSQFYAMGDDAYSCDILDCYGKYPERHIKEDAIKVLYSDVWDLVIAHPPCTFLTYASSMRMFHNNKLDINRYNNAMQAKEFFMQFYNYPGRIAIENPIPLKICNLPPYDQLIQPYYFGEPYSKPICLWLRKVAPLMATCIILDPISWVYEGYKQINLPRQQARSHFFKGIAEAMAKQWRY